MCGIFGNKEKENLYYNFMLLKEEVILNFRVRKNGYYKSVYVWVCVSIDWQ